MPTSDIDIDARHSTAVVSFGDLDTCSATTRPSPAPR